MLSRITILLLLLLFIIIIIIVTAVVVVGGSGAVKVIIIIDSQERGLHHLCFVELKNNCCCVPCSKTSLLCAHPQLSSGQWKLYSGVRIVSKVISRWVVGTSQS